MSCVNVLKECQFLDASRMKCYELLDKTSKELSEIHQIEFYKNRDITDEILAGFLRKAPNLRQLKITNCKEITEKFLQILAQNNAVFSDLTNFSLLGKSINHKEIPNLHLLFPSLRIDGKKGLLKRKWQGGERPVRRKALFTPGPENHTPVRGIGSTTTTTTTTTTNMQREEADKPQWNELKLELIPLSTDQILPMQIEETDKPQWNELKLELIPLSTPPISPMQTEKIVNVIRPVAKYPNGNIKSQEDLEVASLMFSFESLSVHMERDATRPLTSSPIDNSGDESDGMGKIS